MGDKSQTLREVGYKLLVYYAGYGDAHEGTECDRHIVERARLALLNEFLAGSSFGFDDLGDRSDLSPFFVCAGEWGRLLSAGSLENKPSGITEDLQLDLTQEKDLGLGHIGK